MCFVHVCLSTLLAYCVSITVADDTTEGGRGARDVTYDGDDQAADSREEEQ